jgi:paraquat-inducible protein B
VKFQGVPVGRVTDLLIQIQATDKTFQVPVEYEVDLTRLTSGTGTFVDLDDPDVLRQQIADGLRAQLQMESIVTGQLYVELTYRPDAGPPELESGPTTHPRIPTSQSMLAAFGTQAGSVVGEVLTVLFRVNEMLESIRMEEINQAIVASAGAVERLAGSEELWAALEEVPGMTAQFNRTMAEMERLAESLGGTIAPLQAQMAGTNEEMVLTLQSMRAVIDEAHGMFTPDSGIGYQMEGAMVSLQTAADALRALALSLERNPDMLLRGKKPNGN